MEDLKAVAEKINTIFSEISELKTRYSYEIGLDKKGKLKEDIEKLYMDILHIQQTFNGEKGLFVKLNTIDSRISKIEGILNSITRITTTVVIMVIGLLIKATWELIAK